ncbi:hypothetical protein V710_02743 [Staphylococcus aureus T59813]|nr:hypothetical protein V710_02743 [Staphylococcus aureus T59813]
MLVKLFISEIVHTEDSFLLKLYYKFNFATEPIQHYINRFFNNDYLLIFYKS